MIRVYNSNFEPISAAKIDQTSVGRSVAIQQKGWFVAIGTTGWEILILDTKLSLITKWYGGRGIVLDVRFNPLEEELVYASTQDGAIKIIDIVMNTEVANIQASKQMIYDY